jgi:hypothetical protein
VDNDADADAVQAVTRAKTGVAVQNADHIPEAQAA